MYKMNGPDKLYSDTEFPIENVNADKLKKVFKLVEIDVSEVMGLTSSKRLLNFEHDKSYYKKPIVPPHFNKNNQNKWSHIRVVRITQEGIFRNRSFLKRKCLLKVQAPFPRS
ncbi:hypothetical protein Hanom_Chr01g00049221 [Helianthus anomalus]